MRKQRIGILGGTFNPPHFGHERTARRAAKIYLLDKVLYIPCGNPPHKSTDSLALKSDRLHMVRLATEHIAGLEVCDLEIHRPGLSYTVNTLRILRKEYGRDTDLFFIVGGDVYADLTTWNGQQELFKLANFVVMPRPNQHHISSTRIRELIRDGQSVYSMVPAKVVSHIHTRRLYR